MTPHSARAALDAARGVFAASDRYTAPELWHSAQGVLQGVIGRPELTGQALVTEVRQLGLINLADAHALVALAAWADRSTGLAENEAERILVREAWMALEHAIPEAPIAGFASAPAGTPPTSAPHQTWAPGGAAYGHASAQTGAPAAPPPFIGDAGDADRSVKPRRRWLWPAVGAVVLLAALGGAGTWWFTTGQPERELAEAISAYQRGSREVARTAFARLAMEHPDDARPLIYIGRITREDGDLARARTFLTNAVRLAPESAVARGSWRASCWLTGNRKLPAASTCVRCNSILVIVSPRDFSVVRWCGLVGLTKPCVGSSVPDLVNGSSASRRCRRHLACLPRTRCLHLDDHDDTAPQ